MEQSIPTEPVTAQLINLILAVCPAERIWLLGKGHQQQMLQSVFIPVLYPVPQATHYFMLVLCTGTKEQLHLWRDAVEQYHQPGLTLTLFVLDPALFTRWQNQGHRFAAMVIRRGTLLYDQDNDTPLVVSEPPADAAVVLQACFTAGLSRSREFLAGAELYVLRQQCKMAAFMLHQAAEQALYTLVAVGTGFFAPTHNMDRLLRYASLVAPPVVQVFPGDTEKEKALIRTLQQAYSDARYNTRFQVTAASLSVLIQRIQVLQDLLIQTGKQHLQNQVI